MDATCSGTESLGVSFVFCMASASISDETVILELDCSSLNCFVFVWSVEDMVDCSLPGVAFHAIGEN